MSEENNKNPLGRPNEGKSIMKLNFFADRQIVAYIKAKEKKMGLTGIRYNKSDFFRSLFRDLPDWEELTNRIE